MGQRFCAAALVPPGVTLERVDTTDTGTIMVIRGTGRTSVCPECGSMASRVHSQYVRHLGDLPLSGRPVRMMLRARRFRCDASPCTRRIFAERFGDAVVLPWARRTARLDLLVFHLGIALGGRPAARLARRLMTPVSRDTLLRAIRRRGRPNFAPPTVIGIDDWAWRRNQRYGTIICDLERRRPIRLLSDREPATATAWLMRQPQITTAARDRGGAYALAVASALPDATTAAERLQYEGYLRREETSSAILKQAEAGLTIREIVRRTGHSRGYVRAVLRGRPAEVFRSRESSLDPWLTWLDAEWTAGRRNGAELWRRLRQEGFRGSRRVVTEWATRRRRAENVTGLHRVPSARKIARLLTTGRDTLSKSETITIAAIEQSVPSLVEAREIIAEFHAMIRKKAGASLELWLERAQASPVSAFARGIRKDLAAVRAAIVSPWSNGQTEGQITKLKLVKRQMYGRAKLDLLEARLIGAVW